VVSSRRGGGHTATSPVHERRSVTRCAGQRTQGFEQFRWIRWKCNTCVPTTASNGWSKLRLSATPSRSSRWGDRRLSLRPGAPQRGHAERSKPTPSSQPNRSATRSERRRDPAAHVQNSIAGRYAGLEQEHASLLGLIGSGRYGIGLNGYQSGENTSLRMPQHVRRLAHSGKYRPRARSLARLGLRYLQRCSAGGARARKGWKTELIGCKRKKRLRELPEMVRQGVLSTVKSRYAVIAVGAVARPSGHPGPECARTAVDVLALTRTRSRSPVHSCSVASPGAPRTDSRLRRHRCSAVRNGGSH